VNRKSGSVAVACLALHLGLLVLPGAAGGKEDWPPIDPAELAMKDNPAAPGQHAMVLFTEVNDDFSSINGGVETVYRRLKIFTDSGKIYGNLEIPYIQGFGDVESVQARTIHADGKIFPFEGQVYDKVLVKAGGVKRSVKSVALPEVQPGSILEYRYKQKYPGNHIYDSSWDVQSDLFTKKARFLYHSPQNVSTQVPLKLMWRILNAPSAGFTPIQQKDGTCLLEVENIPALEMEDFMPPEDSVRTRIDFFYLEKVQPSAEFWKDLGKKRTDQAETFIGKRGAVEAAAREAVAASDSPDVKMQKLYALVQKIPNTATEQYKTSKEEKREKRKSNENIEDVLKHNYGAPQDLNLLYVGLLRAAGLEAYSVLVAPRNRTFFNSEIENANQLRADVVLIVSGQQQVFVDPACNLCPYGMLPWYETLTQGLKLSKQGSELLTTPASKSLDAVQMRTADFKMNEEGDLEGTLTVDFTGLDALWRREDQQHEDETGRRKFITDEIKAWLPANASVELTKLTGWTELSEPLHAEATVKLPGFGSSAGRRMLMPAGIFQAGKPARFQPEKRTNSIYFPYPSQVVDLVTLHLPEGMQVESLPPAIVPKPGNALTYELECKKDGSAVHIRRASVIEGVLIPQKYYAQVRGFYQTMKTRDEQQIVLQSTAAPAGN